MPAEPKGTNREGKVIIVTGSGGGIGLSIVKGLLSKANVSLVIAVDILIAALDALSVTNKARLEVLRGDVSERAVSQQAVDAAIRMKGRLDSVILNAGILKPTGPMVDADIDDWVRLINVNFIGLLHGIQLALPYLQKNKGSILMTSSGVSVRPHAAWIPYACSKAAMNCLAAGLAIEEEEVSVLCVTPGIVDTGMQRQVRDEKSNFPEHQYNWLATLHQEGKLLKPEEPAETFVSLAVDGVPKKLNGQLIAWDDPRIASQKSA